MKKILQYSLILAAVAAGCRQEEDDLSMGRPEDRIDEMLNHYKQQLVSSPYGWRGYVFPGLGGGFSFHFDFTTEGRVVMLSDINNDCATESFESSFRMAMTQRPSLFFDTYSYLHILSDPNPDTIGGTTGQGLMSDFEFAFESTQGDTMRLTGNQHGTPLILIKATAAQAAAYKAGDVETRMADAREYNKEHPFSYIQSADGKRLNASFNLSERKFSLSFRQADTLDVTSVPFAYTPDGLFLQHPVRYKGIGFQNVLYDEAKRIYYIESDGVRTEIRSSADPVFPLHLLLGIDFSVISVPPQPLEGWSPVFYTVRTDVSRGLVSYGLALRYVEFDFNTGNNTMNLNVFVRTVGTGENYLLQYPYAYTKTSDGVFRFAPYDEPNANGEVLKEAMEPFLRYIDTYRFRMEYFEADTEYVAQLKCVEEPGFYFTGNFGSAWD